MLLKAKFKRSKTSLWSFQLENGILECCDNQLTFRTGSEPAVLIASIQEHHRAANVVGLLYCNCVALTDEKILYSSEKQNIHLKG